MLPYTPDQLAAQAGCFVLQDNSTNCITAADIVFHVVQPKFVANDWTSRYMAVADLQAKVYKVDY
jgi:hypothetical protein